MLDTRRVRVCVNVCASLVVVCQQALAVQAANSSSALRQAQLTSNDMLLNVQLHGPSIHGLRGIGETAAGRGVAEEPLVTGRDLRRQLLRQMEDPHSMLRSQTAITHIAAAPMSVHARDAGQTLALVCDQRTAGAVLRLGEMNNGRYALAALEPLVAITDRSVSSPRASLANRAHCPVAPGYSTVLYLCTYVACNVSLSMQVCSMQYYSRPSLQQLNDAHGNLPRSSCLVPPSPPSKLPPPSQGRPLAGAQEAAPCMNRRSTS